MKGFYRMLNVECWRMLKGVGVIGLVLIIAQWFIFHSAMKGIVSATAYCQEADGIACP